MPALTCCLDTWPISKLDPNTMEVLAYTSTETCLYDYSTTETFYVLAKPPAIATQTLFSVSTKYAYQWFGLNGSNGLIVVYYPFFGINFTDLTDPCACEKHPPTVTSVTPDIGSQGDTVTIGGTFFTKATEVDFGGVSAAFSIVDAQTITAVVPAGTGTVDVQVTNPYGTSALNPPFDQFQYHVIGGVAFDPTTALAVVLSNNNLTATNTGTVPFTAGGVKCNTSKTSGKPYFEITVTSENILGGDDNGFGLCEVGSSYSDLVESNGVTGVICFIDNNGGIYIEGSQQAQLSGMQNGDVIGIAYDFSVNQIWLKVVGGPDAPGAVWNADPTANPATGVGGLQLSATAPLLPYVGFDSGITTDALTANFGATSFVGAVPNTFESGWNP